MNLINLKEETSFVYKNEVYYYLNPTDIKKLPITEKYKEILMSASKILPIDRNTIKAVGEAIRQIKINRKKFPDLKPNIEKYYKQILEDFFSFNIGTSEACDMCKSFSPDNNPSTIYEFEEEQTIILCNFEEEIEITR